MSCGSVVRAVVVLLILVVGMVGGVQAAPILVGTSADLPDPALGKKLAGYRPGKDKTWNVQWLAEYLAGESLELVQVGKIECPASSDGAFVVTGCATDAGTWSGSSVDYFSIKAGNAFALYAYDQGATAGSWDTSVLGDKDLSHIIFWSAGGSVPSVPEPGSLLLLGSGIVALGVLRRRRPGQG